MTWARRSISALVSRDVRRDFDRLARDRGMTRSALLRELIEEALGRRKDPADG